MIVRTRLLSGGVFAALVSAAPVMAQSTSPAATAPSGTQEIIVTAQKRAQNLRDVPIAVTVVSGDTIAQQQINNVADLKRVAPALEFGEPNLSPGGGAFIRGLGTTVLTAAGEPSTSLVVDGVPQGNLPLLNLFDVARVEVLRGPQGTLFGQSVSAGVINITTVAPDADAFSGFLRTQYSNKGVAGSDFGKFVAQGAVNLPVTGTAAIRLSGHYDDVRGIARNILRDKSSRMKDYGVRGRFRAELSDTVTVNLIGEYNRTNGRDVPFFTYRDTTNPGLQQVLALCGIDIGPSNSEWCSPFRDTLDQRVYGASAQFDVDLGSVLLTSISAYRHTSATSSRSIDHLPTTSFASPFPNILIADDRKQNQVSQELRLTSAAKEPLEWVLGGFFNSYTQDYAVDSSLNLVFLPAPIPTVYRQKPKVTSYAAFGQATYHFNKSLRLILGGRITRNIVEARNFAGGGSFSAKNAQTDFSWRIGGQYDVAPRATLYATVSEGFKGQTFDDTSTPAAVPRLVRAEIPTAYEIGLKGSQHGLNYDFNAFWVDISNYQAQTCSPDAIRGLVCIPQNLKSVTSKGFELAVFGTVAPGLSLNGGVAYTHALYPKGFLGADGGDLGGKQLTNSARWKLTGSSQYDFHITDSASAFISGDVVWRSRVRYDTSATDRVTFKPHAIVGARAGVKMLEERLEFAAFVRNLFNVHEPVQLFNSLIGQAPATPTTPAYNTTVQIPGENFHRQVGLSAELKF